MIYEENIKLYEKKNEKKYNPLLEEDDTIVSKDTSQSGNIIFSILFEDRHWFLNSKYDSEVMAKGWSDLCEVENVFSTIFIFGFANGDYVKEISKKHPDNIIIVYEPSIKLFDNNMRNIDLSSILNNEKILVLVGHQEFVLFEQITFSLLDYSNYSLTKMFTLPNYNRIFKLEHLRWIKLIESKKQSTLMNFLTEARFEESIAKNTINNIIDALNQYTVSNLKKKFESQEEVLNRPVIIVSAGPSLDKNVKDLKKAQNKALIICVDSAISPVIKAGVRPDLIATIDPNKSVSLFEEPESINIPLICDLEFNYKILEVQKGKRIYNFDRDNYIDELIKEHLPEFSKDDNSLISGGSVANTAFSLAVKLGYKDIILVGQDLAYPDNQTHSKDSRKENITIVADGERYFEVEDVFGNMVLTETNMNKYREWFEEYIRVYNDINVYDATEGGAKIKGAKIISLEEIVKEKCESLEEISLENIIDSIEPLLSKEVSEQLIDKFFDTQNLLGDIRKGMEKIIRTYEKLNKLNISGKQGTNQFAKLLSELKEEQEKLQNRAEIKLIEKFNIVELNDIQLSMYEQQENEYESYKYLFQKGIRMMEIYLKSSDDLENEIKKVATLVQER